MSINVPTVEKQYGVKFIGFYDLPNGREHVYVFYQANPKTELGHSNYLGVFVDYFRDAVYLTDAKSILEAKYPAISCGDGKILCSRYRHDYQTYRHAMIDGGLAYTRCHPGYPPNGYIHIVEDHEEFVRLQDESSSHDNLIADLSQH